MAQERRYPAPGASAWRGAAPGSRLRSLPHRPPHRGARPSAASRRALFPAIRSSAKSLRARRTPARRHPRGRLLDWRRGRRLLVLPPRHGEPLRPPVFTGYSVNGGYAEFAQSAPISPTRCPPASSIAAAPLLCAGVIGFRSLRVAGVERGERVGLYGFGSSASLAIRILRSWNCEVYVVTRGERHRKAAEALGAAWVGDEDAKPPVELDRAITFAPPAKSWSTRSLLSERAASSPSTPSTSTGCPPSIRPTALGRAPDPQRGQHDAPGRARFSYSCVRP